MRRIAAVAAAASANRVPFQPVTNSYQLAAISATHGEAAAAAATERAQNIIQPYHFSAWNGNGLGEENVCMCTTDCLLFLNCLLP